MKRLEVANVWLAVTALVVTVGVLLLYRTSLPPQVPLWYSRPWGEDQLTQPIGLWLVPGLIALVAVASPVGRKWLQHFGLLSITWVAGTMIVQLILALALIRIVWLVVF